MQLIMFSTANCAAPCLPGFLQKQIWCSSLFSTAIVHLLSSLFSKTKKNPKETYLAAACFLKQLFIFGLFAERERKLMHVPSAFENTEIPLHCHEVKIPHSSILKLFLCSSPSSSSSYSSHHQEESRKKERCVQLSVGFTSVAKISQLRTALGFRGLSYKGHDRRPGELPICCCNNNNSYNPFASSGSGIFRRHHHPGWVQKLGVASLWWSFFVGMDLPAG
jgi:hypothetical protein